MAMDLDKLGVFDDLEQKLNLNEPITRGEYITLIYRANNAIRRKQDRIYLAANYDPQFTDIDSSHPAYKYVQAFANAGFSVGYEDNTFKPDQFLTREEMVVLKVVVNGDSPHKNQSTSNAFNFNDFEELEPKYRSYFFQAKVTRGQDDSVSRAFGNIRLLKPKQPVLGYEAVATIWRFKFSPTAKEVVEKLGKN